MSRLIRIITIGLVVTSVALLGVASSVSAQSYGSGSYGSCNYGNCPISVVSGGNVSLPVIPTGAGVCTVASDTVGVSTSSSLGYDLKISSTSAQTGLMDGTRRLAPTTGSATAPATMAMNSWGYRVDGGAFGSGPTSAQQNAAVPARTFAAMPASASPATLVNHTSTRPAPDSTTVWFGVCANTSQAIGSYTGTVMYTAVVNQ